MSQRRAGLINRCPGCKLNNGLCVCATIGPFKIQGNISLVVHVRELKLTSNTAQFVEKILPNNSKIFIRGRMNETFAAAPVLETPGRPIFLFPHEDAFELNEEFKTKYPGPYHLIVPDGNWTQAKKVRQREALFQSLPAVKLPPGIFGGYKLRKAPRPEMVSTFEAVAHALGVLEGEAVAEKMLTFFENWVKVSMYNRTKDPNAYYRI
jgi:DTW domain-containing protein YfiP